MTEGKRPGGLTALAVLNFVFAGFGCLAILGMVVVYAMVSKGIAEADGEMPPEVAVLLESKGILLISLLLMIVGVVLLIMSGIGYLGQKKFLGRTIGTVYAVTSLANNALVFLLPEGQFGMDTMIGLVYPVLTLILINTTFKEDLVN